MQNSIRTLMVGWMKGTFTSWNLLSDSYPETSDSNAKKKKYSAWNDKQKHVQYISIKESSFKEVEHEVLVVRKSILTSKCMVLYSFYKKLSFNLLNSIQSFFQFFSPSLTKSKCKIRLGPYK